MLNYLNWGFVAVVEFAVGRMVVFDGVAVVVVVAAVVEWVIAVANAEHCDVLVEASVAVDAAALAVAADGDAYEQEQGHLNSCPSSCRVVYRTGCSFAADSTVFEYSVVVEVAVVAAELAAEILYFELVVAAAAAAVTFALVVGIDYLRAILEEQLLQLPRLAGEL